MLEHLLPQWVSDWWRGVERAELKLVTYAEADPLLKAGWRIAKEEDANHVIGIVYLERMEAVVKKKKKKVKA